MPPWPSENYWVPSASMLGRTDSITSSIETGSGIDEDGGSSIVKARQRVAIRSDPQILLVGSRHDYSEEEAKAVWYSKDEIQTIKECRQVTVNLISAGRDIPFDDELHCMDGLLTKDEDTRKRSRSRAAQIAVFVEQEQQRIDKCDHPGLIKDAYKEYTRQSQVLAHTRAVLHARQMNVLWKGDPSIPDDSSCSEPMFPPSWSLFEDLSFECQSYQSKALYVNPMTCNSRMFACEGMGLGRAWDDALWMFRVH